MPRPAASCPATPALPHCMPCIVSSIRIPPDASHALHCLDLSATPALPHCMPCIVSSIRIPPDASHALYCLDLPSTPALPHYMPCIAVSILPSYFIHHVLDVIARNRICPVFSILSYHTLLIRLIHSILSYPILSYPSHLSPCTARPGTPGMLSGHFRVRCPSEASRLAQFAWIFMAGVTSAGTPGMLSGHFRSRCPSRASHLSQFP